MIRLLLVLLAARFLDAVLQLNPSGISTVSIDETAADGESVTSPNHYSATGQGADALYYYSITSITPDPGVGNEPFRLVQSQPSDANTASIEVQSPPGLDFETTTLWTLVITVQDLADPSANTDTATLAINVSDVNEPPRFLNLPGSGSVGELVTAPQVVKLVSISDDENPTDSSGINITIILPTVPAGAPFEITDIKYDDPTAGIAVVTIKNTPNPGLDYESGVTSWVLTIEATDIDGETATADLIVDVLDENEPIYISNLPDTQVVGETMYGQIFAVEAIDVDINATIPPTWDLSTNPADGPFTIDALGNINVIPPGLNIAVQTTWTLTVTVIDAGGLTDTKDLIIKVSDENVGPIILNLPATKNISEDTAGGRLLFTVDPYDADGDLAVCMFTPNPNDGSLEFNSTTYQIWLSNPPSLDHDITSKYEIIVRCNDGMAIGPPARFTINILPVNKPPEILSLPATVTVPEDAINKANIFFVDGYDVDGDNLDFSIASVTPASGLGKFFISNADTQDADVGIVANPNFDYEDINQYIIVIEATDGEFTATGTLNVDITDVNEPPVFFINPQTLYLNENEPANTILNSVVLSVTDPDDGPANLTFAVVNSPESPFFKVSADPWLKVRKPMDYETDPTRFQIQVSVTDSASNTDHLIIDVHLVNLNDNPPIFTMDPYVGTVFESDPGGTSVLVVSATDADGDSIVYDIEPDSLYIEVDDITGEVRLKQPLNRETLGGMIQVTVIATDDGDPEPLTGVSYINITIKDVNDNAPVLTKEFYNWEIRHDADIGTYINRVTATDKDFGNNGLFTFSLLMDHVYFSIDDIGKVSVSDKLKAEMEYLIFCRAEDSGNPSETSDISVIRIDAFVPQLVLINVHLGIPVTDFTTAKRTAFLNTLNGLYPPWQFRISAVQSEDVVTSSTRRLLASNAVLEMYALQDDITDNLDNVKLPKEFVHASTLVNSLTVDDAGTPSAVLAGTDIVLVEPTYPVEIVVDDTNWWLDTLEGNIVLGVLCSIGFLLLMIALIICCWKCCCCGRGLSGFCARCCSNLCKKKTKNIDDRPYEWELQKNEEPDVDKQKMDTSDVPEPTETGPKKPLPKDDEIPVTPYGGGKFDFRYAGRPHPGGPQTLKAKDQPTLILAPSTPTRKSTGLNRTARTTPVLQRRGGRVSPEVSGDNDNVHVGNRSSNDSIFNGSAQDDVTTTHQTEEKKLDPSPHTPRWVTGTPDVDV